MDQGHFLWPLRASSDSLQPPGQCVGRRLVVFQPGDGLTGTKAGTWWLPLHPRGVQAVPPSKVHLKLCMVGEGDRCCLCRARCVGGEGKKPSQASGSGRGCCGACV